MHSLLLASHRAPAAPGGIHVLMVAPLSLQKVPVGQSLSTEQLHTPAVQLNPPPVLHASPHPPQLALSVCSFTQAEVAPEPHKVVPEPQVHAPEPLHVELAGFVALWVPPPQTLPQEPQLLLSVNSFAQLELQQFNPLPHAGEEPHWQAPEPVAQLSAVAAEQAIAQQLPVPAMPQMVLVHSSFPAQATPALPVPTHVPGVQPEESPVSQQ